MNLIAINELKSPRLLKEKLAKKHELILTSSGKPVAILVEVRNPDEAEADLRAVRDARSRLALTRIRESAGKYGAGGMSPDDINEIIRKTRSGKK